MKYTIEVTYDVPHYRHRAYNAASLDEAIKKALADEDWENQETDYDCSGPERITGAWKGEEAYVGDDLSAPYTEDEKYARLRSALVGLIADIRDHWDGNERDLDVIADDLEREFSLADEIAVARTGATVDPDESQAAGDHGR